MKVSAEFRKELEARRVVLAAKHEVLSVQMATLREQHVTVMQQLEEVRATLNAIETLEKMT